MKDLKRLVILLLIFFSCEKDDDQSSIIEKIPDKPILVLSVDDVSKINYETINFISKSSRLNFDDFTLLNPSAELIYSFHLSGKNNVNSIIIQKSDIASIDNKYISDTINYNGSEIYKYKDYYISKNDNFLVLSQDKLLIENVLRDATFSKNDEFYEFEKLHSTKTKNISLIVSENFKNLSFNFKKENIDKYSNWIQYEFDLENDDVNILGVSEKDAKNREINMLNGLEKSKSEIINIIPNNFSDFKRMSFDKAVIENNFNNLMNDGNILEKKMDSIINDVKEIAQLEINNKSILILDYKRPDVMKLISDLNELDVYRGEVIFDASKIILSDFDILNFKLSSNYKFIININNFLILSDDISIIQNIILNYKNQSLLSKNENFLKFAKSIPNKTTFFEIINYENKKESSDFPYWFLNYEIKGETTFKSIFTTPSFELVKEKGLELQFSKKLTNDIIINPTFINNYKLGKKNIIFQDSDLKLILLGLDEKIIFERQLDSKIISEIFQVDLYKNNRLQFMFLTNKQLIVLDINGNFVKRIDLKKSESKKYLSVFDYDKNRNYRIVIQNGKSIKMLDSKFNDVKGFKRTKLKTEISHKLKHHRILNKDYLTIVDEDGAPLILDRRGNIRIKLPKNIRTESSNFFINSNSLININNLNQLVRVELNGKISTKQFIDENQKIFADNDNLLIHSNGKLIINNNEFNLPYGNFDGLNILKSKEKTYYHIRSDDDNQSYLFNKMGMVRGFPIFSKSNIDIAFEKNQDLITTKGDDDEVLLYVIN